VKTLVAEKHLLKIREITNLGTVYLFKDRFVSAGVIVMPTSLQPASNQPLTTINNDQEYNYPPLSARAHDGEEGGGESPAESDMPDSLIRVAETVISPMPVHQLRLLVLEGFPADWIERALIETGHRGRNLKGKRAVDYARRILRDYREEGGPPDDDRSAGRSAHKPNAPAPRRNPGETDFSDVENGKPL
jgi:hypothetical protein